MAMVWQLWVWMVRLDRWGWWAPLGSLGRVLAPLGSLGRVLVAVGWSFVAGEFCDGFFGAAVVDEGFAFGGGGDERGDCGVVELSG